MRVCVGVRRCVFVFAGVREDAQVCMGVGVGGRGELHGCVLCISIRSITKLTPTTKT